MPDEDPDPGRTDETIRLFAWELDRLLFDCGYQAAAARELAAAGVSWHDVDRLLRRGCPLPLARRILL